MIPWKFCKDLFKTDLENWFWKEKKNTDFWKSKKNGKSDNPFFDIFWTLGS